MNRGAENVKKRRTEMLTETMVLIFFTNVFFEKICDILGSNK